MIFIILHVRVFVPTHRQTDNGENGSRLPIIHSFIVDGER